MTQHAFFTVRAFLLVVVGMGVQVLGNGISKRICRRLSTSFGLTGGSNSESRISVRAANWTFGGEVGI